MGANAMMDAGVATGLPLDPVRQRGNGQTVAALFVARIAPMIAPSFAGVSDHGSIAASFEFGSKYMAEQSGYLPFSIAPLRR